jgi:hypothetical protein
MGSWQKAFPRSPNDVPRCLRCDRNWPLCWHRGPGPAASRPRAAGYGRTEARGLADSASSHREIRTTVFPTKNLYRPRSGPCHASHQHQLVRLTCHDRWKWPDVNLECAVFGRASFLVRTMLPRITRSAPFPPVSSRGARRCREPVSLPISTTEETHETLDIGLGLWPLSLLCNMKGCTGSLYRDVRPLRGKAGIYPHNPN